MSLAMLKPKSAFEKKTSTTVDTVAITPESIAKWKAAPFQRPVRENEKVRNLAEQLKKDGGVLPGVLTIGVIGDTRYVVDGQHRLAAFKMSGLKEAFTDVRFCYAKNLADLGEEFVLLNSQLVRLRPDDLLRGLEDSIPCLRIIRDKCPYIGYDNFRRNVGGGSSGNSSMISMATAMRIWKGSAQETPAGSSHSAPALAQSMDDEETQCMIDFFTLAYQAFGRDTAFFRLWTTCNLTICMWLYRRMVMTQYSAKTPKLSKDMFRKCLMSLAADPLYCDWLVGRNYGERDRGPAYAKVKYIFVKRLEMEMGKKVMMPQPPWASRQ